MSPNGIIQKILVNNNATRREPEQKTEVLGTVQTMRQYPNGKMEEGQLRRFRAR